MATLQLPANNLANLANLPPGTKLYLTTNSKNPSGKGKLLLIPQGAILRASSASESLYSFFHLVQPLAQETLLSYTSSTRYVPRVSSIVFNVLVEAKQLTLLLQAGL